jgi:hypothetical protein
MEVEFWILTPPLLVSGYLLGRWHNGRGARDRFQGARPQSK